MPALHPEPGPTLALRLACVRAAVRARANALHQPENRPDHVQHLAELLADLGTSLALSVWQPDPDTATRLIALIDQAARERSTSKPEPVAYHA